MRVRIHNTIQQTTLLCVGLIFLLVGIGVSYSGKSIAVVWLAIAFGALVLSWKFPLYRLIFLALFMGLFGFQRGSEIYQKLQLYQKYYGKEIILQGTVSDDPGIDIERNQTVFHVVNLHSISTKLPGRVQILSQKVTQVKRGDRILVRGKLRQSKGTSRQGSISFAEVSILTKNNSYIEQLRARFFDSVQQALPSPHSSLGLGYLVGLRVSIPKELSDQLVLTGLSHIIAVSGYNLTIIVHAVRRMLGKRSAYQSVVITGLLLVGFLLVSGSSAPIVRASIVCGFSLVSWYYGRVFKPLVLLLLGGAITAFMNPLYIWGDPGWYLSFLAFAGILILAPLITAYLYKKKSPHDLAQIFIETFSAQACTIPYTLYLFGGVSLIAPIANIVVLPFIPIIMFIIIVMGVIGMIFPFVAAYIGLVPSALLTLQMWLVAVLSKAPLAHIDGVITAGGTAALFSALVVVVLVLQRITKTNDLSKLQQDLL